MSRANNRIQILCDHLQTNNTSANFHQTTLDTPFIAYDKFEEIKVSIKDDVKVAILQFNRPKQMNTFSFKMANEMVTALKQLDTEKNVHCIIITGDDRSFSCGADLKELGEMDFKKMYPYGNAVDKIGQIATISKPVIGAVAGLALGGGCETALLCDIVIAGEKARFALPEIKIGTIPGAGGTQRLTRAVGKSKAMEMILTGRMITAQEALASGIASQVVPTDKVLETALKLATEIASLSNPISKLAKEAVDHAYESSLNEGLHLERKLFISTFKYPDRKEGMDAFKEKRKPNWSNEL
ncbi:enoyl-CoA hydratase [Cavenderia fasciculata]|uniref:Enoyl-CoA hydratase n=1 Tax=Cavenderia fasciculata TaxID=261658 RepID=F4Q3C6_CACFS|nr:enoyl-CoA hydratase [Cavenderia fasciculata]EGG17636.1 enoyl-CoA hydratase [Cavenderia fasciculata]|eukprot:XP_004356120.1 enoyl-CoA hydratase [Cavenderia fasciculata]